MNCDHVTVRDLVEARIIERPMDGNHGEMHPKKSDFVACGIPFIMASDLINGRVDTTNCVFITQKQAESLRKGFSREGDILISHKATIGRTALVSGISAPFLMLTPQVTYYRVINDSRLDRRYLKAYFDSPDFQSVLKRWSQKGSTRDYLGITAQLDLPIVLPDIKVQRRIGDVLGALEDKIEINRVIAESLESITLGLFKSWFVDFDPALAKASGRDTGLPKNVAALFPNSLERTRLGSVPTGWDPVPISSLLDVNPPRSLRKGTVAPYLDMANMPTKGHAAKGAIPRSYGSGTKFENGDTLLARITPCLENGKTAFVDFLQPGEIGWGSTEYIILRAKPPLPDEYAYCVARTDAFRRFAIQKMTGSSGRQRVPPEALDKFYVPRPDENLAKLFGRIARVMFTRVRNAMDESRALNDFRAAVLPKLIAGEIISVDSATDLTGVA